jgi:hypothetical protein
MKYLLPGILVMFLVIIIGAGAFVLGKQTINNSSNLTPTPTTAQVSNENIEETKLSPTTSQTKEVQAGGVLSFPKYTVTLPEGWTSEREQGENMDKLTLTKENYVITINEAAFGGSGCLYPGDPPSEMAQTFTAFVEINTPNGFLFRRSGGEVSNGKRGWTLCQKTTGEFFGAPTMFGHVSISGPATTDAVILAEVDSIISSFKK